MSATAENIGALRDKVVKVLRGKNFTPSILGVAVGEKPDEILFKTSGGELVAKVSQNACLVLIAMPSGKQYGIRREHVV